MSADEWDDDRPGMMRVHVAQERARLLCEKYTRDHLRAMCRERGLTPWGTTKDELAFELALAGVKP
jgi:hypothetical protein